MPRSCFQTRGRILKFQELGSKYPKRERVCLCYERHEAHHFMSFRESIRVYSVIICREVASFFFHFHWLHGVD